MGLFDTPIPPQINQLLDSGVQRTNYQNPLFAAMTSGAYQMLPDFAKSGGAGGLGPMPAAQSTPQSSGLGGAGTAAAVGLPALMALLSKGASGMSPLEHILSILHPNDPTYGGLIQGDKPLAGGTGFPPVGGGGGGSGPSSDPTSNLSFIKGNPNAAAINPIFAPLTGSGDEQVGDWGKHYAY